MLFKILKINKQRAKQKEERKKRARGGSKTVIAKPDKEFYQFFHCMVHCFVKWRVKHCIREDSESKWAPFIAKTG